MRHFALVSTLTVLATVSSVTAQMIGSKDPSVGGKVWAGREAGVAGYRVFRKGGVSFSVVGVVQKSPWYHFTDGSGKKTSNLIDSVERIEPILQADLDRAAAVERDRVEATRREQVAKQAEEERRAADASRADETRRVEAARWTTEEPTGEGAREAARVSARTTARTRAPTGFRSTVPVSDFVDKTASNIGTTPTGLPLHMGPRGGIYHYSASGKKVYQRKK